MRRPAFPAWLHAPYQAVLGRRDRRARLTPLERLPHAGVTADPLEATGVVDIVTVAFANPDLIGWQQQLLARNLRDPRHHTVVDNSPTAEARARIRAQAAAGGSGYVDVSALTAGIANGSLSHGIALNWAWYGLLRSRAADAVAFLDHDVYPVAPTSLLEPLVPAGVFGDIQDARDRWFLWPGLCCFTRERLAGAGAAIDFRPEPGVADTGARNWRPVYAHVDRAVVRQPHHRYGQLREGDDPQGDRYELIGDWLHSINGSHWKPVPDRDALVAELVSRHLR